MDKFDGDVKTLYSFCCKGNLLYFQIPLRQIGFFLNFNPFIIFHKHIVNREDGTVLLLDPGHLTTLDDREIFSKGIFTVFEPICRTMQGITRLCPT